MPEYTVYLKTFAHTSVTVEAEDHDEAIDKALSADMPSICAQCAGWGKSTYLELGDMWDVTSVMEGETEVWNDSRETER